MGVVIEDCCKGYKFVVGFGQAYSSRHAFWEDMTPIGQTRTE